MRSRTTRNISVTCSPDVKTYIYLAKRAKEKGVSIGHCATECLMSFFLRESVSDTRPKAKA